MDRNEIIDKKRFKDTNNKICLMCKNPIDDKQGKWVNVRDYSGKKLDSQVFFHLNCWKDRYKLGRDQMENTLGKIMKQAGDMMEGIGMKMGVEPKGQTVEFGRP